MATGDIPDPYGNYNFVVEIDGIARAAFQEASGLTITVDVIEHREGNQITTPRKLPGMTKYTNITLKYGITDDMDLYNWHKDVVQGKLERKNGSIILLDRQSQEVARWNFVRAWPTKYDGPSMNAEGTDVGIETFEIVHEGLERVA
jgi:phage tail-like protein